MIRILHTADWHLGREFHGRDLTDLHQHFFDWLAATVEEREIDLVLMAGDIYDRALPPVSAVKMLNRELARLSELADVVLISGNHDSVVRMGHGALLKESICLRSGIDGLGEPIIREEPFPLAIYPIPYLDPPTMANLLDLDETSHHSVLEAAIGRCRDDLASRPSVRSVLIGHAFIAGSKPSESERSVQVGGSESVPSSDFDGFDYVALGHLHRPQTAGSDRIRYSGSPIPLSFSEVGDGAAKSVTLIELGADGSAGIEEIEVPQLVRMERIEGKLEDLLADPSLTHLEDAWLEVTLTDEVRPDQPMERLHSRFRGLVHPRFAAPLLVDGEMLDTVRIRQLEPIEIVSEFVEHVRGEGRGPDAEELALFRRALDEHVGREARA